MTPSTPATGKAATMSNGATVRKAADVRTAVRAAVRGGTLGDLPAGLKIGVRSGVDMIYIEIEGAPDDWSSEVGPSGSYPFGRSVGSAEANALAVKLGDIAREQAPRSAVRVLLGRPSGTSVYLDSTPVTSPKEG